MNMNRIKDDRREPGETWAHYIKRNIGEDRFSLLNEFDVQETEAALNSEFIAGDVYFSVSEVIERKEMTTLIPYTHVYIGRDKPKPEEREEIASIRIYPNNTVEIDEYDPTAIPPDAKASFEQYRQEEDIQRLADDIVNFARGLLERRR